MIKVFLIDDEQPALSELEYQLNQYQEIKVTGTYTNTTKFLKALEEDVPDVIFMDIEMPQMSGFELSEKVKQEYPEILIVFATAFDQYAIKAFEVNAVDYIVKPVYEERLEKTVERIKLTLENKKSSKVHEEKLNKILAHLVIEGRSIKIPVKQKDYIVLLEPEKIIYCEVEQGIVKVITKDGIYTYEHNLSFLENELYGQNFFRCHRAFLVNMDDIKKIKPWFNDTWNIVVDVGNEEVEIPLSRRRMKELKVKYHI
jgi:DNA-binding LytR/AlgR family response regulator